MIGPDVLLDRLARGRELLGNSDLRALVAFSPPRGLGPATRSAGNVAWFAGFTPMWAPAVVVLTERTATVVATGFNEARLFTQRSAAVLDVRKAAPLSLLAATAEVLAEAGVPAGARIGIAGVPEMTMQQGEELAALLTNLVGVDTDLQALRLVRHPAEVEMHRRGSEVSDRMIERAFAYAATAGASPARLMAEAEHVGRAAGADLARLWLSTGPAPPSTLFEMFEMPATIAPGDRIQLGTMVSWDGYYAQGLRIAVRGKASAELTDMAATLCGMQDRALALLRPGRPVHELDDLLEAEIDQVCPFARQDDPFRFQSCHGLGLDYGEPGVSTALSPNRDRSRDGDGPLLRENMVFEIHPNFTMPGLGHVCAGDVAVVTATGAEWLTKFPRGITELP